MSLVNPKVGDFTEDGRRIDNVIEGLPIYSRKRYTAEEQAAERNRGKPKAAKPKAAAPKAPRSAKKGVVKAKARRSTKPSRKSGKSKPKAKVVSNKRKPIAKKSKAKSKAPKKTLTCLCRCGTPVARKNLFARGHVSGLFKKFANKPKIIAQIAVEAQERLASVNRRRNVGKK